jgi:hypothetical protein
MRDLFAWQLVGDVLKVGAYVYGYLVIAKASLRFYILTCCHARLRQSKNTPLQRAK